MSAYLSLKVALGAESSKHTPSLAWTPVTCGVCVCVCVCRASGHIPDEAAKELHLSESAYHTLKYAQSNLNHIINKTRQMNRSLIPRDVYYLQMSFCSVSIY